MSQATRRIIPGMAKTSMEVPTHHPHETLTVVSGDAISGRVDVKDCLTPIILTITVQAEARTYDDINGDYRLFWVRARQRGIYFSEKGFYYIYPGHWLYTDDELAWVIVGDVIVTNIPK